MPRRKVLLGQETKTLMTGATGFLGSHVAKMLERLGHNLTIIKRKNSSLERIKSLSDKTVYVNIEDGIEESEFDYFFHIATNYGKNGETFEEILKTNVDFPLSILDKVIIRKSLFNFDTSLPPDLNPYSLTKFKFLEKLKLNHPEIKIINLKLEHFFGPKDGKFIDYIINGLKLNKEEISLTKGEQIRDFVYYKDVLTAIEVLLKSTDNGDYSVGSGHGLSLKEVVLKIKELSGNTKTKLLWGSIPYRETEVMYSVADTKKLTDLGWKSQYSIDQGVREILSSF